MTDRLARDVLRYWLSLLRHEEALVSNPKARRPLPPHEVRRPQLTNPAAGQDYVKIPYDGAASLLVEKRGTATRAMEGEVVAFFEHWLHAQYRGGADDQRMQHLVFFPTLLLPRQELGGLLRFDVDVTWRNADGSVFVAPATSQRRTASELTPPIEVQVSAVPLRGEDTTPFFVDFRLLRQRLCIDDDRIDALTATLDAGADPQQTVTALWRTLHEQIRDDGQALDTTPAPPAEAEALLMSLSDLTARRLKQLGSACRAFDTAVLVNTARNRATFHVQRDLQALITADEVPEGPLSIYLSATRHPAGRSVLRGRWPSGGTTASQRAAAETFLGSSFAAVQGPPGTGKTHMILCLAAHQLVESMARLARNDVVPQSFLLVTSTNNRAVDNVIEALCAPAGQDGTRNQTGLDLALRVGSREVLESVTARQLDRARRWLERCAAVSIADVQSAKQRFLEQLDRVERRLAPHAAQLESQRRAACAHAELAEIERQHDEPQRVLAEALEASSLTVDLERISLDALNEAFRNLEQRLTALSALAEPASKAALVRIEQHYQLTERTAITPAQTILGAPLRLPLPPTFEQGAAIDARREAWEEAAELALERVARLREGVEASLRASRQQSRAAQLRQQMAATPEPSPAPTGVDWEALDDEQRQLFDSAVELRNCWVRYHRKPLGVALKKAAEACRNGRSLRASMEANAGFGQWLRQVFPVWGCTLLSLGNNFGPQPGSLARVVVDEAGQCHPAHVSSALLRARSAMLVGDTNQLEPVVELTSAQETRVLRTLKVRSPSTLFDAFRIFEGSNTSAQSLADAVVEERPTLIDHFRCQREIIAVSDELCGYGLNVHTPSRSCRDIVPALAAPLILTAVAGSQERFAGSWCNRAEVDQVVAWLGLLLEAGIGADDVGVVTPFRGQSEVLWRRLRELGFPLATAAAETDVQESLFEKATGGIALGTVHRFQGGERRIMLFSTTATRESTLQFLDARVNLVNVAASRAKEHLVTIGDAALLGRGRCTRLLVQGAERIEPR